MIAKAKTMADKLYLEASLYELSNDIGAFDRIETMADELAQATRILETWIHSYPKDEKDVDEYMRALDLIDRMLSGPAPRSDEDELAPDSPRGSSRAPLGDFDFNAHWQYASPFITQKSKLWAPRMMLKGWVKNEPLVVTRQRVAYAPREYECFGKESDAQPAADRRRRQQQAGHLRGHLRRARSWAVRE